MKVWGNSPRWVKCSKHEPDSWLPTILSMISAVSSPLKTEDGFDCWPSSCICADSHCTWSQCPHYAPNTVNSVDALEERRTENEILLLFAWSPSVIIIYCLKNISQHLSRLLSISFRIRASRAALMAESRMFFCATRSTTFSGLSSFRNRKNRGKLRQKQNKRDQRARNISQRDVH